MSRRSEQLELRKQAKSSVRLTEKDDLQKQVVEGGAMALPEAMSGNPMRLKSKTAQGGSSSSKAKAAPRGSLRSMLDKEVHCHVFEDKQQSKRRSHKSSVRCTSVISQSVKSAKKNACQEVAAHNACSTKDM